jgi:hypothetical protein
MRTSALSREEVSFFQKTPHLAVIEFSVTGLLNTAWARQGFTTVR